LELDKFYQQLVAFLESSDDVEYLAILIKLKDMLWVLVMIYWAGIILINAKLGAAYNDD
jgi:hypothetical protein